MKGDKWTGIRKEGQGLRDTIEGEGQWDRESDREQGQRDRDRGTRTQALE